MITRRTKVQLLVFLVITLVGVTYVGARYARLDRVFRDDTYTVIAQFERSGGIFSGAEVNYRGVQIGRVDRLELTDEGVDVYLDIEKSWDEIPDDTNALVANRSAVGEQFVELQPNRDDGPYLEQDSTIAQSATDTPIQTEVLLANLAATVGSVDQEALRTTVSELGQAFGGTGDDLQRIIDTSTSFIDTADENFPITQALLRDSNVVLEGQIASESSLRQFARELSLFSETLAGSDQDLRRVIDSGSFTANQLRTFLEQNQVDLGELIGNLVTTGDIVTQYLPGIEQILVLYPYIVEGGMTVVDESNDGLNYAHFGLILSDSHPCTNGYLPKSQWRDPVTERGNAPMDTSIRCEDPPGTSNPRGAQNAPRPAPAGYDAPEIGSYDSGTGQFTWGTTDVERSSAGSVAPPSFTGEESWKWLYVQPLTSTTGLPSQG